VVNLTSAVEQPRITSIQIRCDANQARQKRNNRISNMPIGAFIIAAVLILAMQRAVRADYRLDLRFHSFVVIGERVVFSDTLANGLVCISRKTGTKEWEINKDRDFFHPFTTSRQDLLVLSHKRISRCDPATGNLTVVYQADSELAVLTSFHEDQLLLQLRRAGANFLVCLDLNTFREKWRMSDFVKLVACSSNTVFAVHGKPPLKLSEGIHGSNTDLLAIDHAGRLKWKATVPEHPDQSGYWYQDGQLVGSHLLVRVAKGGLWLIELQCLGAEDGKLVNSRDFSQSPRSMAESLGWACFAEYGTDVLAWAGYDHFGERSNFVYSVTVPQLEARPLFQAEDADHAIVQGNILIGWHANGVVAFDIRSGKKLWQTSPAKFCGIHQGLVYCSTFDERSALNGILEINPFTGQQRLLYSRNAFPKRNR
jgi:outer membrane protein assembly factor BamB